MGKNEQILNNWKKEIDQYEKLTLEQAQELYKRIINCENKEVKKQLRYELITGTFHVLYKFINSNGYMYMNSTTYDMNDIINSTVETWIKKLDSGEILNIDKYNKMFNYEFYNTINKNIGVEIDIHSEEYLHYLREFIDLIADYLKQLEKNPNLDHFELVKFMRENKEYFPLLEIVNRSYHELKLMEEGKRYRSEYWEKELKKTVDLYNIDALELFDAIIESINQDETEVHLTKTTLYKIKDLAINNGLEYKRENLDDLVTDDLEKEYDKKELRSTLIELIDNCAGTNKIKKAIILERFGFYGRLQTLEEIGALHGYTRERVRMSEAKTLRQLRYPSRANKLKDYLH